MSGEKVAELQPSRRRTRTRKEKEEEKDKEEKDEECTLRKTQDLNQWVMTKLLVILISCFGHRPFHQNRSRIRPGVFQWSAEYDIMDMILCVCAWCI